MNYTNQQFVCQKVLVTDDDPDQLFVVSRILKKAGYTVEEAGSGQEAIGKAKVFMPDVMLLDVVMPDMDGFEVCRQVKSDPQLKDVSVMLLSSFRNTPGEQAGGLDAGADDFIARPFHQAEFLSRVRSMMRIKTAEAELRMQRQWFQITLSSIGDGLIATDEAERILFMNPVAEKITGWTLEEARLRDIGEIFNIVYEETHQPVSGPIGKVLKEGEIVQLDDNVLLIKKNQQRIPIADSASPIRQEDGSIIGGVLVFRDITERKISEQKITQALKEWGAMFRAIGQMTLIIDPHHGILDANDIALEKIGLTREQVIGRKCFEIIHGSSAPVENCPMKGALASGHQVSSPMRMEKVEGDYLVSCTPIRDSSGNIGKIIHIATDVSPLRKAENELRESESKYRTLFKSSSEAILLADVDTLDILDANETASAMYGYSHEELIGLKATDLSNEKERTAEAIRVDHSTEVPIRYHRKKDGTVFPVEISSNYLTLGGRKTVLTSIRDISHRMRHEQERKELEAHLRQVQKLEAIGTLSSGIAHDFNNILSSVIGYSELSLDMVEKGEPLEDFLQEIYSAGKRAKNLVRQILTFARQTDEDLKPVRIGPVVKEVVRFLRSSVPTTIDISHNIRCDDLVQADPTQIHQVLMNLCTNAAQAMEKSGGTLEIDLSNVMLDERHQEKFPGVKTGEHIQITVSDTGAGIPREHIESIFEPYFTTKAPGEGTGLGLAMVHGIVKRHYGHISVRSEVGKGTSFRVCLPVTEQPSAKTRYTPKDLPTGDEHILFVDDERPIAKMGGQVLESLGYRVTVRTSSTDALELFRAKPDAFDLVITDMTMPGMTGEKLASELIRIRSDIPIILCTGYGQQMSAEAAAVFGIRAFAYKPVVKAELAEIVRNLLDGAEGAMQQSLSP